MAGKPKAPPQSLADLAGRVEELLRITHRLIRETHQSREETDLLIAEFDERHPADTTSSLRLFRKS